jgi:SSS family solute:Na+ symporter
VAANVSAFNTVVTYDLWQDYFRPDEDSRYYVRFGRWATVVGIAISIGTAFIAKGYSNVMNYVQLLFSYFNAPLFATFLFGMFWKRTTPWAGLAGLVAGTFGAFMTHLLYSKGTISFGSPIAADFWGAGIAFGSDLVVTLLVTLVTKPKPESELRGLVWSLTPKSDREVTSDADAVWWRNPFVLAGGALVLVVILNIIFI